MNIKSFYTKEFLVYGIPLMLTDLAIQIGIYEWLLHIFTFTDAADLVLRSPRCLYFLVMGFIIALTLVPSRLYERGFSWKREITRVFLQCLLTLGILAASVDILFHSFAGHFFLYEGMLAVALISLWHLLVRRVILTARKNGRNKIHVVIVGEDDNARRLDALLSDARDFGDYKLVATFGEDLQAIDAYLAGNKVHQLYCSLNPALKGELVNHIIRTCENRFIEFFFVPNLDAYPKHAMTFEELGPMTLIKLRDEPLANPLNAALKRALDIVISLVFLLTLFPLICLVVAIGTALTSPGPVFFKQKRTGYKGNSFNMYKFRSMKLNAESDTLQATKDDPRVTRFGSFLRRSSIDELPQFINVLRGDMSVIGPRPHMEMHTEVYTKLVDEYLVRHMVRPGLTGWAQVNGCRGETPTTESMAERVRLDIWYIEHWSLLLDVKIFFMTIAQIVKGSAKAY